MFSYRYLILAVFVLSCPSIAAAQDDMQEVNLTGVWDGYLVQGTGSDLFLFRYAMSLVHVGDSVSGSALIQDRNAPELFAEFAIDGDFTDEHILRFRELTITEQNLLPDRYWCVKSGELRYSEGPVRGLKGDWTAPGCVPGQINLVGPIPQTESEQPNSLEMVDLLKLFMPSAGTDYLLPWHIGAEPGSPIDWHTSGIENSPSWGAYLGSYHRRGEVVLTINGDVTHHVLRESLVPGTWDIYLFGPRIGVTSVSIRSDLSHELVRPSSSLLTTSLSFLEYRCSESARATGGNIVSRMEAPNKRPVWVEEWWSCGSGGCSYTLNLFLYQEDANGVECAEW